MKLYIKNDTEFEFDKEILKDIARYLTKKDIELLIIDENQMKELNKTSRGIDRSTDVLSFPLENIEHTPIGSIAINKDFVVKTATALKHSTNNEFALMFIHGLLHLLGYDHEKDCGEMRKKEEEIIKKFNLPKSLIVRIEG